MRVGLLMSTRGSSPLIHGIRKHIAGLEEYQHGARYDLVIVVNQSAHTKAYEYPRFPTDGVPIAFIDTAEYGTWGQPWNAFDAAARTHNEKNYDQQQRLRDFLGGRSFPYFLREMWKWSEYPSMYHPIDYPLPEESVCHVRPDRDTFMRREVDVACIWGHSNQDRVPITAEIRASGLRTDVYVVDEDGPRVPQRDYFRRLSAARCTVSFDGYGSSSFRLPEALVRTALLLGPLRIRTRKPLVHGETCLEYSRENLDADPEVLFGVYERGYAWCMEHYTEEATARYVMDTIASHDWSRETVL